MNRLTGMTMCIAILIDDLFSSNFSKIETLVQAIMVIDITDHFLILNIVWLEQFTNALRNYCNEKALLASI